MEPAPDRRKGATGRKKTGLSDSIHYRYPAAFWPTGDAVSRRSFEMYHYRQVLVRMRQGDTDREIARSGLMGRRKAGTLRERATAQGWLEAGTRLPDDDVLAREIGRAHV